MINDQETNDLIWASSHYLCESLPNNFTNWSEKKLDKFIVDNAWQPFEYDPPERVWELIQRLASDMRAYVTKEKPKETTQKEWVEGHEKWRKQHEQTK